MTAAPTTPKANADLFDLVTEMVDMLRLERPSEMFGGASNYGRATSISVAQEKTMIDVDVNGIKSEEERREKGENANHILVLLLRRYEVGSICKVNEMEKRRELFIRGSAYSGCLIE